jgi:diadenosine tetraphosphate (Ap4A) HIT family hydrolase
LDFALHSRLAADCFVIGDLTLCRVLLNNDARFPWCILVPRLTDLRDLHDVPAAHRTTLFDEIEHVSIALQQIGRADKMNVAALGNMVPQLHIHVIARRTSDAAWPAPVWSAGTGTPYDDPKALIGQLKSQLNLDRS